jgi:hypothetical protein
MNSDITSSLSFRFDTTEEIQGIIRTRNHHLRETRKKSCGLSQAKPVSRRIISSSVRENKIFREAGFSWGNQLRHERPEKKLLRAGGR